MSGQPRVFQPEYSYSLQLQSGNVWTADNIPAKPLWLRSRNVRTAQNVPTRPLWLRSRNIWTALAQVQKCLDSQECSSQTTDDFYLGFKSQDESGTIKVDNRVWLTVKETPVWSVEFIHSQFEFFMIGKSDRSVRSDRNKIQFLRIITI